MTGQRVQRKEKEGRGPGLKPESVDIRGRGGRREAQEGRGKPREWTPGGQMPLPL